MYWIWVTVRFVLGFGLILYDPVLTMTTNPDIFGESSVYTVTGIWWDVIGIILLFSVLRTIYGNLEPNG